MEVTKDLQKCQGVIAQVANRAGDVIGAGSAGLQHKVLISVPIFMEGRSPTSHPRKFASRFLNVPRFSPRRFSYPRLAAIRVLNTIENGPDIPMLDDYGITKPLSIFGECSSIQECAYCMRGKSKNSEL
jgi:hypothetical protein